MARLVFVRVGTNETHRAASCISTAPYNSEAMHIQTNSRYFHIMDRTLNTHLSIEVMIWNQYSPPNTLTF